ncbi:MAG: molecular chaperone HtpG [Myxococcales bacterium]|nr:molecular chaperone HtpG [Myxococcales bacterium]
MTTETPISTESGDVARTTHRFEAEVDQVLRLVIRSLYSNPEIFLRELLSNASDALDKRRFRGLTDPSATADAALRIRLVPDGATLTIDDDGVGMTRAELAENLGTIAKSGTRELLEQLRTAGAAEAPALIGQFGVGFYSAFLVADRVDVVSRALGHDEAWRWSSDAQGTFTIEPATRDAVGTSVVLHLGESHRELASPWRLEGLVRKYSDHLPWPIEVRKERVKDEGDDAGGEPEHTFERVNRGSPLWQRPASEIEDASYEELYRHLTHDWEKPLFWRHFKLEGTQELTGLLYVPRRAPFDLFSSEPQRGLRLHVRRVFVMEEEGELLPRWLRFVRGVIDSEDLPLNVSRELLQDSRVTKTIRKQVIKQILDGLTALAKDRPDDYVLFWQTFGAVLKEGLHYEPTEATKLAALLRFESSAAPDGVLVSLEEAKGRLREGQDAIYYALGESRRVLEASPQVEGLVRRGYEVLWMTDPIDEWALRALANVDGLTLRSAMAADLELEDEPAAEAPERTEDAAPAGLERLRERIAARLDRAISEVRVSRRLEGSPACLVDPPGALPPHLERLLRASQKDAPAPTRRVLELNPRHPLVVGLATMADEAAGEASEDTTLLDTYIDLLHEQARVAEGSPVDDPATFARQLAALMTRALGRSAPAENSPDPA